MPTSSEVRTSVSKVSGTEKGPALAKKSPYFMASLAWLLSGFYSARARQVKSRLRLPWAAHDAGPARRLRPSPADSRLQQAADRAGLLRLRVLELLPAAQVPGDRAGGGAGRDRTDHRLVRPVRGGVPAGDGRGRGPLRPARL